MTDTINDVMYAALKEAGFDDNVTAMLMLWRDSLDLNGWQAYVDHVFENATATNFADAEYEFWSNYSGEEPPSFTPADLSPALWIDPSDAATVTISGSSGAYIGPNGLVLPASGTNYATSPDSGPLGITGDIDIIVKITPSDWTPTANSTLIAQWGASTAWVFSLLTTGHLRFTYTGNVTGSDLSTAATGVTDGAPKWVRVTLDADNGASGRDVKFWLSDDGASWTQLGSTVTTATAVTMTNSTSALEIGSYGGGVSELCRSAIIHRVIVKNGIDGTTVFDADFEAATPYVSAFTESALGAPVYVVSSTATSSTASYGYVGPEGWTNPGTSGNRAATAASTAYDTEDFEFVCRIQSYDWSPSNYRAIATVAGPGPTGWLSTDTRMSVRTQSRKLLLSWYDGAAVVSATSTTTHPFADGETWWLKATLDYNAGGTYAANFYYAADQPTEPSSWTQLGSTVTGAQASGTRPTNKSVYVGSLGDYTTRLWEGSIKRAIIRNGIGGSAVFDADFGAAPDYAALFVESSSNAATVTITATNTPANAAGALVSQINDKSGNARHLTQGTASAMPKYWNGRNGLNCLVFNGSDEHIGAIDWTGITNNVFTGAFVRVADTASSKIVATFGADLYPMWSSSSELLASYITAGGVTSVGTMNRVIGSSCMTDASASAGRAWLDGTLTAGTTNTAGTGGTLRLGQNGASTLWFSGEIGELMIATSIPTSDQITSTQTYIKNKWGTP